MLFLRRPRLIKFTMEIFLILMERMLFLKNDKHCGCPVESYGMMFKSELLLCLWILSLRLLNYYVYITSHHLILCIWSWLQVHFLVCTELLKLVDRISRIFPSIEAARPRCSSGIQELCLLNSAIDRTKLHLQKCSDSNSSKFYLVCNLFND